MIILVAILLPVLILVAGLSIDIGNWFEHRRHLQVQATAGALAGGGVFRFPCSDAINAEIRKAARDYSGDGSDVANNTNHNDQVGLTPASSVHRRLNSRFFAMNDTLNRSKPEDTDVDPAVAPCEAQMIDVKLTETDLPWFLSPVNFVKFIDARARVEIRKKNSGKGLLPIGVPDPNPTEALAYFVDEATGAVLAHNNLKKGPTASNITTWASAPGKHAEVPITAKNIGVRIALSGGPLDPDENPKNPLTGNPATDCVRPLVACYDTGSANGLVHIRGYSMAVAGTATEPQARSVELFPGPTCEDAYFSSSGCVPAIPTAVNGVGVRAIVDFGPDTASTEDPPPPIDPTTIGAELTATVGNKKYPLTYKPDEAVWESATQIPVPLDGPVNIELVWDTRVGKTNHNGTFGLVQRAFGATDERSGPIKSLGLARLTAPGGGNSFPRCASASNCPKEDLVVTLRLKSAFFNATQSNIATPVELRLTGTGALTQSLDCDPTVPNLKDELAKGCKPTYRPNEGEACPASNDLFNPVLSGFTDPPGYPCVRKATGAQPNQIANGMNLRILGADSPNICLPSQYNQWRNAFPLIPKDDPRIIQVFLTPFGAFSGAVSKTAPVSRLAAFYVTGWSGEGGGFRNPCQDSPDPFRDDIPATDGSIVGHFMNYVTNVNDGGAGDEACDPLQASLCVAVLTR